MSQKSAFAFSLAVHSLLLAVFVWVLVNSQNEKDLSLEVQLVSAPKKQQTDLQAQSLISVGDQHANTSLKLRRKSSGAAALLFPPTRFDEMAQRVQQKTLAEEDNARQAHSVQGRMKSSGLDQVFGDAGNQNWAHYQTVHQRIDSQLHFDSLLAQYNHFGVVLVQFHLDSKGVLDLGSLRVKAQNPVLKVHVLRAIRNALSEPLPEQKRNGLHPAVQFQAHFSFKRGHVQDNFLKQNKFGQPELFFVRSTEEAPIAGSLVGQIADARLLANPFLIAEKFEKYNRKKKRDLRQFDPFESYRRDRFYLL